jgi:4-diphosphocytidyl-2-C-methyl-D-erythritol kinase
MTPAAGGSERLSAPAKVNLCLQITGRRADGYHLLDSVVVFTSFGDSLVVRPAQNAGGTDSIDISGPFAPAIAGEPQNICLRAISGYREAGGVIAPLSVSLEKHIPVGAGLGGGSSDAAAILRYLDRNATTRLAPDALAALAVDLGADVPVCLAGIGLAGIRRAGTAQHMTSIGEKLRPIDPAPRGHVVLTRPDASLSTIAVFREFAGLRDGLDQADALPPPSTDPHRIVQRGNDLFGAAVSLCPEIRDLMGELAGCEGVGAVQMSGSGSACFALFPDAALASAGATRLTKQGRWAVATDF